MQISPIPSLSLIITSAGSDFWALTNCLGEMAPLVELFITAGLIQENSGFMHEEVSN